MSRHRQLAIVAVAATLTAVACDSGGGESGDTLNGVTPPTSDVAAVDPAPATDPTGSNAPGTTDAPPTPAPTSAPASTSVDTTMPAALVPPDVTLFDIGTFDQPVEVTHRPGDAQVYVVEQPGRVIAVTDLSEEVVLDITDLTDARGEQGLLGLAFDPTGELAYVDYIDGSGNTVVAEFTVDPITGVFDRSSFREVLTVDQPYSNHNGGQLAFGPDQLLYIGLGDGGSGGDPQRHALDLGSRLGKILRIDPRASGDQPFTVPDDNPFVSTAGADPTIWAYGLRNPWRFSFDPATGDLWIADVGQGDFEEIDHAPATDRLDAAKGANFGWSAIEGFEPFNADQPSDGAVAPVFVYDHGDGRCSVSGGALARDGSVPDLEGWYVFGDYCTGQIWALDPNAPVAEPRVIQIGRLGGLAAVSRGPEGDLYAVSNAGTVARFVPAG
ncbi:MAG: PQQ-dependent sugar dehydrogenase [Ilumatobacteraceae bacterium]